jgi:hypothetical protein
MISLKIGKNDIPTLRWFFLGGGGLEGLRNNISFKVIKPKAMKTNKGREGGPKI